MIRSTLSRIIILPIAVIAVAGIAAAAHGVAPVKLNPPAELLTRGDAPAALGTPKPGRHNYSAVAMTPTDMGLCTPTTGQPELTVGGAAGWLSTVVLTGKGYREVNERLNTFATAGAAASTFAQLQSAAARCSGTSRSPVSDDASHPINGTYVNTNSTGVTGTGVWISVNTKVKSSDEQTDGSVMTTYTVYRQDLNVITATWIYFNGTKSTTAAQRRAVNNLSLDLTTS